MTNLSIPALLLIGIAVGPYGLNLVTMRLLTSLDAALAMAVAMLGAFVGLSIDRTQPGSRLSELLLIVAGAILVTAFRDPSPGAMIGLLSAVAFVSAILAFAGWMLVGQTSSAGEQHVFVVGTLLLVGGAATYLSMSGVFGGLVAGLTWSRAGNVAKARIVGDLQYLQHAFFVLVLIAAGAATTFSVEALRLAIALLVATLIGRLLITRMSSRRAADGIGSVMSLGLVAVALALDGFRAGTRPDWAVTLLGGVVMAALITEAISVVPSARRVQS